MKCGSSEYSRAIEPCHSELTPPNCHTPNLDSPSKSQEPAYPRMMSNVAPFSVGTRISFPP